MWEEGKEVKEVTKEWRLKHSEQELISYSTLNLNFMRCANHTQVAAARIILCTLAMAGI